MPWTESANELSTAKAVAINRQDALHVNGFEPFLTLSDSNASNAQARIQSADGKLVFYTQSALNSKLPTVVFNSLIGQPPPSAVEIHAQDGVHTIGYQPFLTLTDANAGYAKARIQSADGKLIFYTQSALNSKIPTVVFDSAGDVFMTGTLSVAKDVILTGADCAEHFDVVQHAVCDPGTVMTIGAGGALDASAQAYDKRVAGVVSGAGSFRPGIVLDRKHSDEGRPLVAMFGKVFCKVDAQYAPIEVGDLLTTSDTIGHAMKACDSLRAFGSVMGKALANLSEGCGLIPILITLQ